MSAKGAGAPGRTSPGRTPPSRILVVDDDAGIRYALERILASAHQLEVVTGAAEALARVDAAEFDLALVDVRLADGDGYALCQAIRRRRPQTDVILITGSMSEPDEKLYRALEEGAFYFLFKPFDRRVLQALVDRCLRLQRERAAKERHAQTLAADLEKARRFQASLLPRGPVAAFGWRAEGRLLSCDALGGDLYLAHAREDAGVVVAVADVVGHGVSAAMVAGMLRSTLDAARRATAEPEAVGRELQAGLDFFAGASCATLFYGLLAPDGRFAYFNAGHPPALLQAAAGGDVRRLGATGTLLHGALRDRPLPAAEAAMAPGDRLLLYSDGFCEARDPAERELGLERLEAVLESTRGLALAQALDALLSQLRDHCAGRPLTDDVTLLLAERTGD